MTPKIVLVDLDGPLADMEGGFLKIWRERFPNEFFIPKEKRTTLFWTEEYPKELHAKIESIRTMEGFVAGLEPVRNGPSAIKSMIEAGLKVFICSAEIYTNKNCLTEKKVWVQKYLGDNLAKTAIFTKDKTMIKGNYLIDDKPTISGLYAPEWEHILFDASLNKHTKGKRRINGDWSNWKEIIID